MLVPLSFDGAVSPTLGAPGATQADPGATKGYFSAFFVVTGGVVSGIDATGNALSRAFPAGMTVPLKMCSFDTDTTAEILALVSVQ